MGGDCSEDPQINRQGSMKFYVTEVADAWIEVALVTAGWYSRFAPLRNLGCVPALPIEHFLVLSSPSVEFRYGTLRPGRDIF